MQHMPAGRATEMARVKRKYRTGCARVRRLAVVQLLDEIERL